MFTEEHVHIAGALGLCFLYSPGHHGGRHEDIAMKLLDGSPGMRYYYPAEEGPARHSVLQVILGGILAFGGVPLTAVFLLVGYLNAMLP